MERADMGSGGCFAGHGKTCRPDLDRALAGRNPRQRGNSRSDRVGIVVVMNPRSGLFAAATAAMVLSLISVATVHGQAPSAPRAPMAEEVFKNIQVLKGIPVDEFMGMMGIIAASVGRGCSECHLLDSSGDWALYAE